LNNVPYSNYIYSLIGWLCSFCSDQSLLKVTFKVAMTIYAALMLILYNINFYVFSLTHLLSSSFTLARAKIYCIYRYAFFRQELIVCSNKTSPLVFKNWDLWTSDDMGRVQVGGCFYLSISVDCSLDGYFIVEITNKLMSYANEILNIFRYIVYRFLIYY